jgi:hypothetical protein
VDPLLSRTVLVTTKLDTKLTQFSEGVDLEDFLRAPLINKLYPRALGGPYFTTVPIGRVGVGKEFETNEEFVANMRRAEEEDSKLAGAVMSQQISKSRITASLRNVGVSRLRQFLEDRIELSYRRNVAKILPLLQINLQQTEQKLLDTDADIAALSMDKLKSGANSFRENFSRELASVIHGTAKVSPEECGETLDNEQVRGGAFLDDALSKSESWKNILDLEVGNAKHKLFGGAQYHRAIREFTSAVRHMPPPPVTEDEIANAAGMGDMHDGVNFMRAACVLAMQKAQNTFDPLLDAMRIRSTYIMGRLFDVVADIVTPHVRRIHSDPALSADTVAKSTAFQDVIHTIYEKFVQEKISNCLVKCRDDLEGMTRFVTWDVDGKGGSSSLYASLPTPQKLVEIYSVALENARISKTRGGSSAGGRRRRRPTASSSRSSSSSSSSNQEGSGSTSGKARSWGLPWAFGGGRSSPGSSSSSSSNRRIDLSDVVQDWDSANDNDSNSNSNSNGNSNSNRASPPYGEVSVRHGGGASLDVMVGAYVLLLLLLLILLLLLLLLLLLVYTHPMLVFSYYQFNCVSCYRFNCINVPRAQAPDGELLQLTEEMLAGRDANRTSTVISALVQFIVKSWQDHFARTVAMKFNCFFLLPFIDEFPQYLRDELDKIYESSAQKEVAGARLSGSSGTGGKDSDPPSGFSILFDVGEARAVLVSRRSELAAEFEANSKLQDR